MGNEKENAFGLMGLFVDLSELETKIEKMESANGGRSSSTESTKLLDRLMGRRDQMMMSARDACANYIKITVNKIL